MKRIFRLDFLCLFNIIERSVQCFFLFFSDVFVFICSINRSSLIKVTSKKKKTKNKNLYQNEANSHNERITKMDCPSGLIFEINREEEREKKNRKFILRS